MIDWFRRHRPAALALACAILPLLVLGAAVPEPPLRLLRSLLDAGTANRLVVNNGSGAMTDAAAITPAMALISDANGIPTQSAAVDSTELSYLDGTTSAIQTQLGTKLATSSSGLALNYSAPNFQLIYTDDGASSARFDIRRDSASPAAADGLGDFRVFGRDSAGNFETFSQISTTADDVTNGTEDATVRWLNIANGSFVEAFRTFGQTFRLPGVTASRALTTDASSNVAASAVTATELGYLSGVTSAVQTQINALTAGGLVLLNVYSPSGASSVDVTGQISGTYDRYVLAYTLVPGTDSDDLYFRTDSNAGASFDTGASDYGDHGIVQSGTTTLNGVGNDALPQIRLTTTGVDSVGGASGELVIQFRGSGTRYPQFSFVTSYLDDNGTAHVYRPGAGQRWSAAAIDAVRLYFSSGTATGTARLYGVKN